MKRVHANVGARALARRNGGGLPSWNGGSVAFLAGSGYGFVNGSATVAKFGWPWDVAILQDGNFVVPDYNNCRVRIVTYPGGAVSTIAGNGTQSSLNGIGTSATFALPTTVAVFQDGNIAIGEASGRVIRVITYPGGSVSTLAGSGTTAYVDGTGTGASFYSITGIAVLPNGNLVVVGGAGPGNSDCVRVVTYPGGVVTTIAGAAPGGVGFADGTGTAAKFSGIKGVAVTSTGKIVVTDGTNNRIRVITSTTWAPNSGVVTTLAGTATAGSADGTGTAAGFNLPYGIAVTPADNIVVTDLNNNRIRYITTPTWAPNSGVVTTLAGSTLGSADGVGTAATFNTPYGIDVTPANKVIVADSGNHFIRVIT